MNEEEFLLKWNNHQINFVDVFNHLLKDDAFVDVTLVCGGEAVQGHKLVLAACSPLLHRILRDNPCKHPVLILNDVPAGDMKAMMRFIYQGEVSVSQSKLASFLKSADNLQIKGLAEDKEKDKDHRSKEERKRKDKDDRSEGRASNKRQRMVDPKTSDLCLPPLSSSFKTVGDSHSSHRNRNKTCSSSSSSEEQSSRNGESVASLHSPTSKALSSKISSSKIVVHGIPNALLGTCASSKENSILQGNSSITSRVNSLLKADESDKCTVKTEPLDYPGEMVWTEGHGAINSDILDDPQPMIPLGAIPTTLEGIAVGLAASPTLPILETSDDRRFEVRTRGDMSATLNDINANNTTGGTWLPDSVDNNRHKEIGIARSGDYDHPADAITPLPPISSSLASPDQPPSQLKKEPPLSSVSPDVLPSQVKKEPSLLSYALPNAPPSQFKEEPQDDQVLPVTNPNPLHPLVAVPFSPIQSSGTSISSMYPSLNTQMSCSNSNYSTTMTSSSSYVNPHKCKQCPFVSSNPYTFTRHLRIHLGTKEFRCRMCTFASSRKDSLIRHFRMKHLTGELTLESRDIEEIALIKAQPDGLRPII